MLQGFCSAFFAVCCLHYFLTFCAFHFSLWLPTVHCGVALLLACMFFGFLLLTCTTILSLYPACSVIFILRPLHRMPLVVGHNCFLSVARIRAYAAGILPSILLLLCLFSCACSYLVKSIKTLLVLRFKLIWKQFFIELTLIKIVHKHVEIRAYSSCKWQGFTLKFFTLIHSVR